MSGFSGDLLNIVFPIIGTLKCSVSNCQKQYAGSTFSTAIQSLIRHIEGAHKQKLSRIQRWCSYCQENTPAKVTSHMCFTNDSFFIPDGNTPSLSAKCHRCLAGFPSRQGLVNHLRKHEHADCETHIINSRRLAAAQNAGNHNPPLTTPHTNTHQQPSSSNQSEPMPTPSINSQNDFNSAAADLAGDGLMDNIAADGEDGNLGSARSHS